MQRHPLDQLSAALGLLTIIGGVAVVLGVTPFDLATPSIALTWLSLAVLAVGVALIPWRRHKSSN